ncbi:hypothetical protein [Amycolatopsis thermoflava]|uniref:hypothetical protein n=1 Tax=Amycolatopsis thermoflava TaxID=84480 RepID=UPI003EBBA857
MLRDIAPDLYDFDGHLDLDLDLPLAGIREFDDLFRGKCEPAPHTRAELDRAARGGPPQE